MLSVLFSNGFSWYNILSSLLASLVLIFIVSPLHELAHGIVAVKLGDNTPKYQGRLSLNPFAHIDYIGALMILLIGFGWAKPVQVNMYNFRNPKRDMALTAIAGPASNLIVAFIIGLFLAPVGTWYAKGGGSAALLLYYLMRYIMMFNVYIALFNLIPIAPLDGSRILSAVLPNKYYYQLMRFERYSFIIILVLFYVFRIGTVLSWLTNIIINGMAGLSFAIFG